jgi:hypothetical protein
MTGAAETARAKEPKKMEYWKRFRTPICESLEAYEVARIAR